MITVYYYTYSFINYKKCKLLVTLIRSELVKNNSYNFQVVGFLEEEVLIIYKMLAAILHLGDIEFGEADDHNADNRATIIDTAPLHRGELMFGNK